MSCLSFDYKCPLCGKVSRYDGTEELFDEAMKNTNTIVRGVCKICHREWAKYASVVFGGDVQSSNIGQTKNSQKNSKS